MFLTEQDDARYCKIQVTGAETAGEPGVGLRVVAGADQVDIAFAVDLSPAEEERIDAALASSVEQLRTAVVERVVGAAAKNAGLSCTVAYRLDQQRCAAGDRRCRADCDVAATVQHPRDGADQQFFACVFHGGVQAAPCLLNT